MKGKISDYIVQLTLVAWCKISNIKLKEKIVPEGYNNMIPF